MAVDHGEREFRFCPHCGGAFNARILKDGDPARLVCDRCGFVFYLDPKVAVGTIIRTADHEIVLCRRAIDRGKTPIIIVWAARVVGGELKVADEESLEVRTFGAETIPWDDLAFESTGEALKAYFNGRG